MAMSIEQQVKMYGMPEADIARFIIAPTDPTSLNMLAMSILSDIQEMLARSNSPENVERARQMMNCAKHCMIQVQDELRKR